MSNGTDIRSQSNVDFVVSSIHFNVPLGKDMYSIILVRKTNN